MKVKEYYKCRIGEKYITNEGYEIEIIEYFGYMNCTIVFNDDNKTIMCNQQYGAIVDGRIKNPNHPIVCNVGYFGQGKYKALTEAGRTKYYRVWYSIIRRCYDKKQLEYNPSYKGCSVIKEWHNFQNFAKWFEDSYVEGWQLDKDILIKGNKVYSPDTCCFVPQEINKIFTKTNAKRGDYPIGVSYHKRDERYYATVQINGKYKYLGSFYTPEEAFQAYKIAKENYIKDVANRWKDLISDKVYQALINYQVEITD